MLLSKPAHTDCDVHTQLIKWQHKVHDAYHSNAAQGMIGLVIMASYFTALAGTTGDREMCKSRFLLDVRDESAVI